MVDLSNLQRQVIHFTPDLNKAKVDSAAEKIAQINPDVKVIKHKTLFMADNALELLGDYDFIIDGTDNFPAKFLINDACVMAEKPFSHGGILRFDGQTMTYVPVLLAIVVFSKIFHQLTLFHHALRQVFLVLLQECLLYKPLKL